jgi:hypothetical protein
LAYFCFSQFHTHPQLSGVPRTEREYWLQETATLIKKPVKQAIGLTSHFPDWTWVRDLYLEATHGKNPPALWWYLYKKTKK